MKSILTVADGGPALEPTLAMARACADLFQSFHSVLHVRDPAAFGSGAFLSGFAQAVDVPRSVWSKGPLDERAAAARASYDRIVGQNDRAAFTEVETDGFEAEVVVEHARVTDLVVVGRPGADKSKPEPKYVSAAIFGSARPVIVVPPGEPRWPARHVVVAWSGAAQAARAVGYAMPLLAHAETVTVLTIGAPDRRAPVQKLLRYLACHGVTAKGEAIDLGAVSARSRGRGLLNHLHQSGADMLVMGAYGEGGTVKQFLGLGGATSKIITACRVPVLVAE